MSIVSLFPMLNATQVLVLVQWLSQQSLESHMSADLRSNPTKTFLSPKLRLPLHFLQKFKESDFKVHLSF